MSRELDELDREFAELERGGGGGGGGDDDGRRRRGGARLLPIAVAVIALAVFGGIVWYAYNQGVRSGAQEAAPLLEPEGQAKVTPDDPGGMEVAHTDKEVYERISGEDGARETVERILPPPEDPMSPPEAESSAGEGGDVQSPEIPSITESESEAAEAGGDGQGTDDGAAAGAEEPPLPDEKLAAPDSEPPTAAPADDATGGTQTAAADTAGDTDAGTQESGTADSAAAPETDTDRTAAAESGADDSGTASSEGGDAGTAASEPAEPEPAPEPEPEAETAAAAPTSGWQVQIAALGSEAAAERAWRQRQEALPDLLGDLGLAIQRAEVDGKVYYRVRGGPLADRAAAEARCKALKARDQACLVVSPGG